MTREERLKALFDELERDAYNAEYHNYYYKEANQIIRKHFELSLPPAEGAEAIVKKYEDEYDFKFHWVQRDRVIRMMREFAAQPQPTAEGAEEIDDETIAWAAEHQCGTPFSERWIGFVKGAKWHRSLHAQRIADKMVEEDDLQKLMNDISEWSDKTFGNGQRNPAIIYHLKKEVDELIAAIEKTNTLGSDPSVGVGEFGRQRTVTRVEYADCLMLLLDSAHHFGISAKELLSVTRGKLEINKVRKWGSPDENGVVEHIE